MRFLTPLLLLGMFLFSCGTASAQAPVIDGGADAQDLKIFLRLRSVGSTLASIVTEATVRSATFRQLPTRSVRQTESYMWRTATAVTACVPASRR